jgi:hypothetical protein
VIEAAGEVDRSTLYDRYCQRVDEPRTDRTVQEYITDLVEYGLVATRGPRQNRTYLLAGNPSERFR